MTASPERMPPALSSMWRLLKLGYRHEPAMLSASFALSLVAALPDALMALWLMLLGKGVLTGDRRLLVTAAAGLGLSAAATWFLSIVSTRIQRRFRDKVTVALEAHIARLQASVATLAHHERPEHLDRLSVLRNQVFVLDHMYMSVFAMCAWILRLGVVVGLLVSIHPALVVLAAFALPTVLTSTWRPRVERAAEERGAASSRLARHLFMTATSAPPGKEVRVTRIGTRLVRERREAWERWYGPVSRARWGSAVWHALAWAIFGCAYVGAIVFVSSGLKAPPATVLLVLAAGSRLSAYIGATVGEIGFLRGIWLDGSRRLAWLEDYAASFAAAADQPAPSRLSEGIRLEAVSFAYPGTERLVLDSLDLALPAGSVVAIVGENGAGKTTLVKLLCKLYEPTAGRILVDGVPLARMPADAWRARLAGAFQDFFRFELVARHAVGVGDLPRLDDTSAVAAAVGRAGAEDVVARLPAGLETQLGPTWPGGAEVSFGQWQKLALARGFMRAEPLLLVLDEPTAALDAETEHALFERYAAAARGGGAGAGDTRARAGAGAPNAGTSVGGGTSARDGTGAGGGGTSEREGGTGAGGGTSAREGAGAHGGGTSEREGGTGAGGGTSAREGASAPGGGSSARDGASVPDGGASVRGSGASPSAPDGGASARGSGTSAPDSAGAGRITILVSHRFSTVRMADLIVVLDGARVAQVGTHDDLMARGGPYAELYRIQAAAYR